MTEHIHTDDTLELRSAYDRLQADHNALAAAAYRTDEALSEVGDQLEAATHFLIGAYRVGLHRDHWEVWGDPSLGGYAHVPDPEPYTTRTEALARARQLAEEAPNE